MKKTIFILCLLVATFVSCSDSNSDVKKCWELTITQVSTMTLEGQATEPQTLITKVTRCGLSESEVKKQAKDGSGTQTSNLGGVPISITTTITYKEVAGE